MDEPRKTMPRDEQETVISFMRDDTTVSVYTSNRPHLDRMRKLANAESSKDYVKELEGSDTWGTFEVDARNFKLFSAIRRPRVLTDEQRVAAAERLSAARKG